MTDTPNGNGTALAKTEKGPLALTSVPREVIEQAVAELRFLIPKGDQLPAPVLWQLAEVGYAYDLDPINGELFILVKTDQNGNIVRVLGVTIGIMGWRRKAQEQSPYMTKYEELDEAEARDVQLKAGDVARKCYLYRLDILEIMGKDTLPFIGYGVVRATENFPDSWNKLSRAKKRAEKDAVKQAYTLRMPKEARRDPEARFIGVGEPDNGKAEQQASPAIAAVSDVDGEWQDAEIVDDTPPAAGETPETETQSLPPTPLTASQQAEQAGITVPHWSDDKGRRAKLWATAKEMDLTEADVRAAMQMPHLADYKGSFDQAMVDIRAYANEKADRRIAAEEQATGAG